MLTQLEPERVETVPRDVGATSTPAALSRAARAADTLTVVSPSPRRVGRVLLGAVVAMTLASAAAQALRRRVESEQLADVLRLFKLSDENTIPAYFSALMLLACAAVLGLIARATRRRGGPFVRHWAALALIFAYLSIDEAVAIHEMLNEPLRQSLHAGGFLHYPWVLAGAAGVLAVGAAYWRFLLHLSPHVRRQVVIAAAVFVGGALGMEMVSAKFASSLGTGTLPYGLASLAEEFMEMTGVALFFRALLHHLAASTASVCVAMAPER